jgi:F-type H+-transporting ATPase subunit gamma
VASVQQIKSRIRSVNSTRQITKAMQLVSASKMRRATALVKQTADYAAAARELLADLAHDQESVLNHPLFAQRPVKKRLLIVITSDSGLAGAYNSNVLKKFVGELKSDDARRVSTEILTLGRKVSQFASKLKDVSVIGSYEKLPDRPTGVEINTILTSTINYFADGKCDAVDLLYTRFYSTIRQEVVLERVLPAGISSPEAYAAVTETVKEAKFEPSRGEVLDAAARRLIESQIVQALLDGKASEHSMRMMAMKNATDNANSLSDDLTLEMNKERQAAITQEISEIANGAEAIK